MYQMIDGHLFCCYSRGQWINSWPENVGRHPHCHRWELQRDRVPRHLWCEYHPFHGQQDVSMRSLPRELQDWTFIIQTSPFLITALVKYKLLPTEKGQENDECDKQNKSSKLKSLPFCSLFFRWLKSSVAVVMKWKLSRFPSTKCKTQGKAS